jgi:hypothetical protein
MRDLRLALERGDEYWYGVLIIKITEALTRRLITEENLSAVTELVDVIDKDNVYAHVKILQATLRELSQYVENNKNLSKERMSRLHEIIDTINSFINNGSKIKHDSRLYRDGSQVKAEVSPVRRQFSNEWRIVPIFSVP